MDSEEDLNSSAKEDKEETSSKVQNGDEEKISLERKQKERDDLQMYEKFFPEQVEYQVLSCCHYTQSACCSIYCHDSLRSLLFAG